MTIKAPDVRTLVRMAHAMMGLWCDSRRKPPLAVTRGFDDTCDTVHVRRLVRRIRLKWPETAITIHGDSHYMIKRHKAQLASDRTSCRSPPRCA